MSTVAALSADHSYDLLLKQAKTAVKQGNTQQARQLLQMAVRQDPQDYRGWLWLATVAPTPAASLEYVNRAEMLAPNSAVVEKARSWAENRLAQAPPPKIESRTPAGSPRRWWPILGWVAACVAVLLLASGSIYAWQHYFRSANNGTVAESAVVSGLPALSHEAEIDRSEAAAGPLLTIATETPQPQLPAKVIASTGGNQPRPTWTVTPTPSPTPTPTPTVLPTFVNPNYQDGVRPFGVANNERWIDVNLTTQTLRAYEGDTVLFTTLISSGTWEHPTVTGQFRIWLEYESQTMDGRLLGYDYYLENVPYVMYFYQDYALHGTFWHNNFGTPMSHGCVNMATHDAAWIYNFATIGTVVNVHY